jgi:hypothetical protein
VIDRSDCKLVQRRQLFDIRVMQKQAVPPILVNVSSAISEEAKCSFLHDVSTLSIAASSVPDCL